LASAAALRLLAARPGFGLKLIGMSFYEFGQLLYFSKI
jgi:hypothetical protein